MLAVLTFDLNNAASEDYDCVDQRLNQVGWRRQLASNGGLVDLPYNTYAGDFVGADTAVLRDTLVANVKQAFAACQVHGRLFLVVSTGWAWGTQAF